jgi:hypothetical protein
MEHGGRLPANCNLTVYYLPVYPPYSDYNYGLRRKISNSFRGFMGCLDSEDFESIVFIGYLDRIQYNMLFFLV